MSKICRMDVLVKKMNLLVLLLLLFRGKQLRKFKVETFFWCELTLPLYILRLQPRLLVHWLLLLLLHYHISTNLFLIILKKKKKKLKIFY